MSAARLLPLTRALRAEAIKALTARSTWIGALLCLTIPDGSCPLFSSWSERAATIRPLR